MFLKNEPSGTENELSRKAIKEREWYTSLVSHGDALPAAGEGAAVERRYVAWASSAVLFLKDKAAGNNKLTRY